MSCSAWSWIAFTTSGWQWPVEQTATPALQSKKILPSTSSTQTPLARSATSLKDGRGYEGLTNFASASMIFLPLGPGSAVLISGRFDGASTLVDIFDSLVIRPIKRHNPKGQAEVIGLLKRTEKLVGEEICARFCWAIV